MSNRMQSCRSLRWMMLFCVLILTAMPLTTVLAQDEEEHENLDEQVYHHEEEQHYEQEQQYHHQEEEQQQEPEQHYQEEVQEEVQEQAQEYVEQVQHVEEQVEEAAASGKGKVAGLVDKVVSEAKSLVNRVKSMNKADAKKVAAAALGVWGVSVGVGWLAQTVKAGAADGGGASVGGPAKKPSFGMKK
jgi:phosphoribosylpyrophosphate synthetase